jgi:cell division protein FtsI (penicillin-binding protein 3)
MIFSRRRLMPKRRRNAQRAAARPCSAHTDKRIAHILDTSHTRILFTGAMLLLAFGAISVRLVDIALMQEAHEPRVAHSPRIQAMRMDRADIVDRNGVLLATNLSTASLYANPHKVMDADEAARQLVTALPQLRQAEVARLLKTDRSFIWLRRNLTPRQQSDVNALGIPGLYFQRAETRVYPNGPLAAHVLGFVDIDNGGIAGIEKSFDPSLRDSMEPLHLTIDSRVQHALTDELVRAKEEFDAIGATGIVMDVNNGEIVAMASLPDFDPNYAGEAVPDALFNRATLGVYELGSTFKIFTSAMALDYGVVTLRGGYDASKPIKISRFLIRDYHAKNRWLSVPEIFMYSSNIGAAKMAEDVGTEGQQEFFRRLGMLQTVPVELPELGAPITPSPWRPINTLTIGYGHGMAVSPLHLASGVAAMVNGGMVHRPTLVKAPATEPRRGERIISERTSAEIRKLMRLVVEDGTGKSASAEGYVVGGKTGTADKPANGGYRRRSLISSFVGAFPMNAPRFVVLAVLDEPQGNKKTHGYATGGWVAAPIVKRVIERVGPLLGVRPIDEESPEVLQALSIDPPKKEERQLASY